MFGIIQRLWFYEFKVFKDTATTWEPCSWLPSNVQSTDTLWAVHLVSWDWPGGTVTCWKKMLKPDSEQHAMPVIRFVDFGVIHEYLLHLTSLNFKLKIGIKIAASALRQSSWHQRAPDHGIPSNSIDASTWNVSFNHGMHTALPTLWAASVWKKTCAAGRQGASFVFWFMTSEILSTRYSSWFVFQPLGCSYVDHRHADSLANFYSLRAPRRIVSIVGTGFQPTNGCRFCLGFFIWVTFPCYFYILEQKHVLFWILEIKFAICTVHRFSHSVSVVAINLSMHYVRLVNV